MTAALTSTRSRAAVESVVTSLSEAYDPTIGHCRLCCHGLWCRQRARKVGVTPVRQKRCRECA